MDIGGPVDISLAPLATDQRGMPRPIDHGSVPNAPGGDGSDIGAFEMQVPTAASVSISGQVLAMGGGRALPRATVQLTEANGTTRTTQTNMFGYFYFDAVLTGQSVIVTATAKGHRFEARMISVNAEITDLVLQPSQ
jgi:hypothetical protein